MALKAVKATLLTDSEVEFTVSAPLASAALSTVLAATGVTIIIGDTADKDTSMLITCIERLRDHLIENS